MPPTPPPQVRFVKSSDQSLLVYFDLPGSRPAAPTAPQGESLLAANENVRRLLRLLELQPVAGVRNLHPAYCSLLVKFDPQKLRHEELESLLRRSLRQLEKVSLAESLLVEIPVCYGDEFGPDLQNVADRHGITPAQLIHLHSSTTYLVYFLGFVPGFAYLGELPQTLVTPRHATPRRKVPSGTVGIAGNQTGIYPCETPGGWQLLGRTPLALVRPERGNLSLLAIGDRVRFKPISREEFAAMERS